MTRCQRVRGGLQHGQVASLSQGPQWTPVSSVSSLPLPVINVHLPAMIHTSVPYQLLPWQWSQMSFVLLRQVKTGVSNLSGGKHGDSGMGKIDTLQLFCARPQITFLLEERVTEFG